ncbi:MAG: hypothetical protein DRH20_10770 [Deltaproteobacteria bacterium]|nr:MAG: hypothetical protein DRH20_10770 [Deltaproteobacteria bacterium]
MGPGPKAGAGVWPQPGTRLMMKKRNPAATTPGHGLLPAACRSFQSPRVLHLNPRAREWIAVFGQQLITLFRRRSATIIQINIIPGLLLREKGRDSGPGGLATPGRLGAFGGRLDKVCS